MRTRSAAGRSTTGIMASQLGVRPPEPSQRRPRLAVLPGDGRGTTTTTPPPRDRHHPRRQEDTCGVSALTPRLRAIQWPPNFKVSNVDKYEPKQDPGGWLTVYTTAARAAGASKDVMTAYLPIVLGQDALQWLRHLPRHCIDDWSDFSRRFTANFQSLSDKPAQPWDLALRRTRPTLSTSASSSAAGRTRRTTTTPAAAGGRRRSLPAR
jgi:hypothetical protein